VGIAGLLLAVAVRPHTHGERVFLHVSAAAIVGLIVLAVGITAVRRRRSHGRGKWWPGPYADTNDPTFFKEHRDETR
jgi:hypothetical protein